MSENDSGPISALTRHRKIALDSNVLIYLIETRGPLADAAAAIVDAVAAGRVIAVMSRSASSRSWSVLRGGETRSRSNRPRRRFAICRSTSPQLDSTVAEDAAWIRGAAGVGLEDAVHLAAARAASATAFVTNDRRLRSIPNLEVVYLDDLVA